MSFTLSTIADYNKYENNRIVKCMLWYSYLVHLVKVLQYIYLKIFKMKDLIDMHNASLRSN
jgi:hypothetical protein